MTVLVALEHGKSGEELLASARVLAHVGDWGVRVLHVKDDAAAPDLVLSARLRTNTEIVEETGAPAEAILAAAGAPDVDVLAFCLRSAADRGVGHVADALLRGAPGPLFVTRRGMPPLRSLKRILVPLEGSPSASEAMRYTEQHFCERGREIVVLHVATADMPSEPGTMSAPRMVDQEQYEWSAWHEEFTMRFSSCPEGGRHRTLVRVGLPSETIVAEAASLKAEMVVVAWSQELGEGRAAAVKALLERSPCPLLFVPATAPVDL
jgi:nucleotide-binding universal stress UspA family protein